MKADGTPETAQESKDRDHHEVRQQLQMAVRVEKSEVKVIPVKSLKDLRPDLSFMTVRRMQNECERWGIRVSGTRQELQDRLLSLFQGHPTAQKGCTKQFVMLQEGSVAGRDRPIFEEPSSASASKESGPKGKKVQPEPMQASRVKCE